MASLLNMSGGALVKMPYDAEIEYLSGGRITLPYVIDTTEFKIVAKIFIHKSTSSFCLYSKWNSPWSESLTTRVCSYDSDKYFYYQLFGNNAANNSVEHDFDKVIEVEAGNYYVKNINTDHYYFNKSKQTSVVVGNSKPQLIFNGQHRIYYAKYYRNGNLICDFIPVRVGQVGYMYDKVSGQLFGNSDTGDFILGPDV